MASEDKTKNHPLPFKKRRLPKKDAESCFHHGGKVPSASAGPSTKLTAETLSALTAITGSSPVARTTTSSQVSLDDRSVASIQSSSQHSSSSSSSTPLLPIMLTQVNLQQQLHATGNNASWRLLPKQTSKLYMTAIRAQAEAERLKVYKAMLFESYVKAVKECEARKR
jgi:uncharacterized Zn-finger protein